MKKHKLVVLLVLLSSVMPFLGKAMTLFEIRTSFYSIANHRFPNEFTTNFTSKNGLIFVNANLNGKESIFLLDSGLGSNLLLNSDSKYAEDLHNSDAYINGMGGGKCREIEMAWISNFNWKGITLANSEVSALPLSHISRDDNFAGIIGFDIFKNYILTLDYKKHFLKARMEKDLDKEQKENGKLLTTIPFEMKDHMPVFEVEMNGKKYKMGLDTGASVNVMHEKHFKDFGSSLSDITTANMKGFNGECKVKRGKIKEAKIGGLNYNDMSYNFEGSSLNNLNKQYKYGIDGLIGYEFLNKYITVIDFKSKEIRVYEGIND